ncbi:MAG TPA: hypothetical protein VMS93_08385 [Candidatus Saccharimonadales bacterium]|nr:hypothetical protein [Candidatus Saccharimonadales bacterium]
MRAYQSIFEVRYSRAAGEAREGRISVFGPGWGGRPWGLDALRQLLRRLTARPQLPGRAAP